MPEQWLIRVEGKEYGPADLEMLREWKQEGRVLASNEARRSDSTGWTTAATIPGLFEGVGSVAGPPPIQTTDEGERSEIGEQRESGPARPRRTFAQIFGETCRIYFKNFRQFFCLSLLIALPFACRQLTNQLIGSTQNIDLNLRTMVVAAFAFCMFVLGVILWPIYIAAIQIVTADALGGRRTGFLAALNEAVRYWPRVAALCLFVYGVFFLLFSFGFAIALMLAVGSTSLVAILFALGLLVLQVWLFGRFFVNVLFWQQFAVLENTGVVDSLRESRSLARSGHELSWFRRPLWRGAFLVSIWTAFVLAITIGSEWSALRDSFHLIMSTQDPQALAQKLGESLQAQSLHASTFGLSILQRILQPLLGVSFVVLYFDSRPAE